MDELRGSSPFDFVVVGGGIVGSAVTRELLLHHPGAAVILCEKESAIAAHQSGHNSGVVHAGVYYRPGTAKATLSRRGAGLLKEFCEERGLGYEECGKLIIARDQDELGRLAELERRASSAGVPDLQRIGPSAVAEREPHVIGVEALLSPSTAVVDFAAVAAAMIDDVVALGGQVALDSTVRRIRERGGLVEVDVGASPIVGRTVVICAGLQSDLISKAAGGPSSPAIVPFRGEYFRLPEDRRDLVRGLVYPVPDPRYPFLGVHFTRRIDGAVDVGPNALLGLAREGYRRRDVSARDVGRMLAWPGFWRMAGANWRAGAAEVVGALSRRAYLRQARSYIPELRNSDLLRSGAGVRAQAVDRRGRMVDDFVLVRHGRILSVRNAPSPAATASLAIAAEIVRSLQSDS
jgi:L-2-hydroxyglutarate oxidase LhgO